MLQGDKLVEAWSYRKILPGSDIDSEISEQLESCDLFLPLVSPDFLASGYCQDVEMTRALERRRAGHLRIVPIIIRPCDWKASSLRKLMSLPSGGKPVSKWEDKDEALLSVVLGLRQILTEKKTKGAARTASPAGTPKEEKTRGRDYRVKREFDAIDRSEYRENAFAEIRSYFEASVEDINKTEGIRARLFSKNPHTFNCTVVNSSIHHGTAHITVHTSSSSMGMGAMGDIWYSFSENDQGNSAEGILSIESDGYDLHLKPILMFSVLMGQDKDEPISPETAAERMWRELLDKAGVSYD